MACTDATPTARTFDFPYYVTSNGSQLFIADVLNNRVLMWSAIPTTNFAAPTVSSARVHLPPIWRTTTTRMGSRTACRRTDHVYPCGVFINGTKLFVTDNTNARFLIYSF